MTELISNRSSRRIAIKEIITQLNSGRTPQELKDEFQSIIKDISPQEIAIIENELMNEGVPKEEIKLMCDVHILTMEEFTPFKRTKFEEIEGHPTHTFIAENKELNKVLSNLKTIFAQIIVNPDLDTKYKFLEQFNLLMDIEKHYQRKEMLLFPILEKHGFDGPSKIMWSVHDDIRLKLKKLNLKILGLDPSSFNTISDELINALSIISNMINKEEKILIPTAMEMLTEDEWYLIMKESESYGYTIYVPENLWEPKKEIFDQNLLTISFDKEKIELKSSDTKSISADDIIKLPTGRLSLKQLILMFKHFPYDVTFIDKNDVVVYYSHGQEKIFMRTNAILGRKVHNCHPPSSFHMVDKILKEFKDGSNNKAEFWIDYEGNFVYICFYAIRNENGEYQGTMEIVQNATHIRGLQGEKRIHS